MQNITASEADGNTFNLTIDIKSAVAANVMRAGDSLYTYYSGVLNENAKIYDNGKEENTAYLTYSNEPNGSGTGKTPERRSMTGLLKWGFIK